MIFFKLALTLCVSVLGVRAVEPGINAYLPPDKGYKYPRPTKPFPTPTRPTPSYTPSYTPPSRGPPPPTPSYGTPPTPSRPTPTRPTFVPTPSRPTFPTRPTGPTRPTRPPFDGQPSDHHDHHDHVHHEPGMPFDFAYAVKDTEFGNDYSHNAVSNGEITNGEYRIVLPDGRTQVVKYTADWQHGYNAHVTFEGQPSYPGGGGYKY